MPCTMMSARARIAPDVDEGAALTETEEASPIYVRDRCIAALQVEPNAPLARFSSFVEDASQAAMTREEMKLAIMAARAETERRLHGQNMQLRRFHQQICLRVNERAMQERARAQTVDKRLDEKLARLLPPRSDMNVLTPAVTPVSQTLSCESRVEALLTYSKQHLQATSKAYALVESAILDDAQARQILLGSTRTPRVRPEREFEDSRGRGPTITQTELGGTSEASSWSDLPKGKQAELYAAVRRRYMQIERERTRQFQRDTQSQKHERRQALPRVQASSARKGEVAGQNRPNKQQHLVNIVDASVGCAVKMQRESSRSSTTPWRRSSDTSHAATTDERFLLALQECLDTPALCSCTRGRSSTPCANNCELYLKSGKKEKLATFVCIQHQAPN